MQDLYYFSFHINKFEKTFSSLRNFHNNIGEIWNKNDKIPPTYIKISAFEKEKADKFINSKGINSDFVAIIPGAAWIRNNGLVKIISQL